MAKEVVENESDKGEKLSAKDELKLFKDYDAADAAWQKAKEEQEKLFRERSAACEKVYNALGSGPFEYGGADLTVTKRTTANVCTYYFRGKKKDRKNIKKIG